MQTVSEEIINEVFLLRKKNGKYKNISADTKGLLMQHFEKVR